MEIEQGAGARIRARRKALGMNAVRLADKAQVSREHLSAVENGHKAPTAEWLRRIELAMDEYARETGQDEPPAVSGSEGGPIRITFHDVYGVGEIIVEGPADRPQEITDAVARLLADLRKKSQ